MPQKYKRREGAKPRETISSEVLKKAVEKTLDGVPCRTVAKEFGLSRCTLRRYVRKIKGGMTTDFVPTYNVKQVFNEEEEEELSKYLEVMALMNHGLTTKLVTKLAYDLAMKNNKKFPENWNKEKSADYFWLHGFMDKHPTLSLRKPEATSLSCATSFNRHNVSSFYNNLRDILIRENFGPERIWNVDETGVTTVQKCPKIIAPKKSKQVGLVTSSERGQLVTMCNGINALGNSIPPFFIFPRVKMNPAFLFGAPTGSDAAPHISGWMTEENFLPFLKHFVKYVSCSVEKKCLLLLDNHESHMSLAAIDFARANGIVILTFPPHCSHRLQPLDVSVYSPFKRYYNLHCTNRLTVEKPGKPITIYDVAEIAGKAFPQAFTPSNITSGFKATGIWPFNETIFTDEDFLCSSITDRPNPKEKQVTHSPNILIEQLSDSVPSPSTSFAQSSGSGGFRVSPEDILPYPKAGERKMTNRGRRKGKTMILTDTPNRNEIQAKHKEREEKKQKKKGKTRVRKALFRPIEGTGLNRRNEVMQEPETESDNSEVDHNVLIETVDSETDSSVQEGQVPKVGDWIIVKYCGKRSTRRFVGKVLETASEELSVKFARRQEGRRFKWPETEDISQIDPEQVEVILNPPELSVKNARITSFDFKDDFTFAVE